MPKLAQIASLFILTAGVTTQLWATCGASLSANIGADGVLSFTATATGACGGSSIQVFLMPDGRLVDSRTCGEPNVYYGPTCTFTGSLDTICLPTKDYTLRAEAVCFKQGPPDINGNPTCIPDTNGQSDYSFSINSTPTVTLDLPDPDITGHTAASITYNFPNTNYILQRGVHLLIDGQDSFDSVRSKPTDTWVIPMSLACQKGTHTYQAVAIACGGTDSTLVTYSNIVTKTISTKPSMLGFSWAPPVNPKAPQNSEDAHGHTTISATFPNTDSPFSRGVLYCVDQATSCNELTGVPLTFTNTTDTITDTRVLQQDFDCGTVHKLTAIAVACRNEGDPDFIDVSNISPEYNLDCNKSDKSCGESAPPSTSAAWNQASTPQPDSSCPTCPGKPINVGSGDVYAAIPLFVLPSDGVPLAVSLSYHSSAYMKPFSSAIGPAWLHSFGETVRPFSLDRLVRVDAAGREIFYDRIVGTTWRAIHPARNYETLTEVGSQYVITDLDRTVQTFDRTTGHWLSTQDRWGNGLTASYDGAGNLVTVTDSEGRSIAFSYAGGLLSTITLPEGSAWRFTYTSWGGDQLWQIFDPLHGGVTPWRSFNYLYGLTGPLTDIYDEAGKSLEHHDYDSQGRGITSSAEGGRDLVTVEYDTPAPSQTRVTHKIDGVTNQTSVLTLDYKGGRYRPLEVNGACATCGGLASDHEVRAYDDANNLISRTDARSVTTHYAYDATGHLLTQTEAWGTPNERTTTYAYGMPNWPNFVTRVTRPSATAGGGVITDRAWNADETVLTTSVTGLLSPDVSSRVTYTSTASFDSRHHLISADGPRTDVSDVVTRSYYPDSDADLNRRGRLRQITSATGLVTTLDSYDLFGTARVTTDSNGVTNPLVTDARGRVTSSTSKAIPSDSSESADYTSSWTFDGRDRLVERALPRGNRVRYLYEDGTNRLTDTIRLDLSGNEVERAHLTLNVIGDKVAEEDQMCSSAALTCSTWVTKRSESFAYDTNNRLVEIDHIVPAGSKVRYTYDENGQLHSVQDENHTTPNTSYSYDELNRLMTVGQVLATAPGGTISTQYAYDPQDNLTSVTDPNGNVTTYAYDDFHRLRLQASPVTGLTRYDYDSTGNLLSTLDANSAQTTRTYDADNRVLSSVSSRSGTDTEAVTWTYDNSSADSYGSGRLFRMTDPTGTTTYTYERRGLLRSEQKQIGTSAYNSSFAYDANGNRNAITYPSGRVVNYTFDFADRPGSVASGSTVFVSSASYLPFGPESQIVFGNGTTKTMTYDARYRMLQNKLTGPSGVIAQYDYQEDATGNITQLHDALSPSYNRDFGYDDLNRLVTANTGSALWGSGSYVYDSMGNMLSLHLGSARNTTFSYSGSTPNLATVVENGATKNVTYDAVGNEATNGTRAFGYSARNGMMASDPYTYNYDGRGIRTITSYGAGALPLGATAPAVVITNPIVNGIPVASNDPLFTGVAYSITVLLTNPDGTTITDLDRVEFFSVDPAGQTTPIARSSQLSIAVSPPQGMTSFTLEAIAYDLSGNVSTPVTRTWTVQPNAPPVIDGFDLLPAPLYIGSNLSATLAASADLPVTNLSLTTQVGSGAASTQSVVPNTRSATQTFHVAIPMDPALEGATVTLSVAAQDAWGALAIPTVKTLTIAHDAGLPVATISQPLAGTTLNQGPSSLIHVAASAADAESGVSRVTATIEGGATVTMSPTTNGGEYAGDLPVPEVPGSVDFTRRITVTATDYAGNVGTASITVPIHELFDPTAPIVSFSCGTDGATVLAGAPTMLSVTAVPGSTGVGIASVVFEDGTQSFPASGNGNVYTSTYNTPSLPDGSVITIFATATSSAGVAGVAQWRRTVVVADRTIAVDTTIPADDLSYDFQTTAIIGGTTTIVGHHEFKRLLVLGGATLTQRAPDATSTYGIDITTTTLTYVGCGGVIDVSGKGYRNGVTYPGETTPGPYSGGSHIGVGGDRTLPLGTTFGSIQHPAEAGGGADVGATAGPGGGIIRIVTPTLTNDGAILANGQVSPDMYERSTAGGSVWITATDLGGGGTIDANGADSVRGVYGSGGGGAISIEYQNVAGTVLTKLTARTGISANAEPGGAGTVYVKGPLSTYGDVTVDNKGYGSAQLVDFPSLGSGVAQAGSTAATLVTDRATNVPPYFVGHWVEVSDSTGALKGTWRIASIDPTNGKQVTLAPNASETVSVQPGDTWQGVYRFDSLRAVNGEAIHSADPIRLGVNGTSVKPGTTSTVSRAADLHVARSLVSIVKRDGMFVIRGGSGAVLGAQPISIDIENVTLGTTAPVVAVGADGSFEATIVAATGDRLLMKAVSGTGERLEIDLGQFPDAERQGIHAPTSIRPDTTGGVTGRPAKPALSPPLALHIERSLVSMAKRGGTFVVRGGSGAVAGAQPISVEIKNLTLGITVPVVVVSEEGAFEATVDAAPGDRLSMRAVSSIGEQIEIGLDQVPGGEPQAILGTRHSAAVDRLHLVSSLITIPAAAAALLPRCDDCVTSQPAGQPRRRPARSEDAVQGVLRRRRKLTHTFKSFQILCSRRLRS